MGDDGGATRVALAHVSMDTNHATKVDNATTTAMTTNTTYDIQDIPVQEVKAAPVVYSNIKDIVDMPTTPLTPKAARGTKRTSTAAYSTIPAVLENTSTQEDNKHEVDM